jgi:hypothetical protein
MAHPVCGLLRLKGLEVARDESGKGPRVCRGCAAKNGYERVARGCNGGTLDARDGAFALVRPENAGALGRIRTCGTRFRKPMLYPLSYEG